MSLKSLNSTQKSAVEAVDGPVLIFAGAGSGKTRVLTHKLFYLVNEGLFKPEEILAVTFTNKAAKEMKNRVMKLLKANELPLSIGTFHSICARILREDIQVLGFSKHFAIYDVKDQLDVIKVLYEKNDISKTLITPNQLRNQISLFKNKMIDHKTVERRSRTILEKTVSKIIINGDPSQIDLPNKNLSGLNRSKRLLGHLKEISVVDFDHSDVVRHPLVSKIVKAYSDQDND